PDSYFAFLSNQKKVAEAEKINGVLQEFAQASDGEKSKIRSRVGTTSLSGASVSSLPSVPSLPSISRPGTGVGSSPSIARPGSRPSMSGASGLGLRGSGQLGSNPGSRPSITSPGSNPGLAAGAAALAERAPIAAPPRSSTVVYILIGILVLAIGVLAVLLFSG